MGGSGAAESGRKEEDRILPPGGGRPRHRCPASGVGYKPIQTALASVHRSRVSWPISRPQPDCLRPPKGSAASKMLKQSPGIAPLGRTWSLLTAFTHRKADDRCYLLSTRETIR